MANPAVVLRFLPEDVREAAKDHSAPPKYKQIIAHILLAIFLIARKCMPEMAHRRLTDLATHFGISIEGAHRALKDSRMTQQVYEHLRDEMVLFESGQKTIPICSRCGKQMKLRNGKFGEFWGCSGYPGCNFTMNI